MATYGLWNEKIDIDGEKFGSDLVDQSYADRAGFRKIYAINGLPARFKHDLIKSSQVSDVPHTWRVQECQSEAEVTEAILRQGITALDKDRNELGTHVMTYVGEAKPGSGRYEFLAAGAIRNKLTRDFQNNQFPVVSRAIVALIHRNKGLGSLIVAHRMKVILEHYFGQKPKAIHFGTESKQILHAVKKIEMAEAIRFVYIGDEQYTASDGTHTVHDFLCFLPWYQQKLMNACDELATLSNSSEIVYKFKTNLALFMKDGVEGVLGQTVETLYEQACGSIQSNQEAARNCRQVLEEVFIVKKKIGACDPKCTSDSSH